MKMSVKHWCNDTDKRKPKSSEINLSQCHFVHHNLPWTGLGSIPGLRGVRPATSLRKEREREESEEQGSSERDLYIGGGWEKQHQRKINLNYI